MDFYTWLENAPPTVLRGWGSFHDRMKAKVAHDPVEDARHAPHAVAVYLAKVSDYIQQFVNQRQDLWRRVINDNVVEELEGVVDILTRMISQITLVLRTATEGLSRGLRLKQWTQEFIYAIEWFRKALRVVRKLASEYLKRLESLAPVLDTMKRQPDLHRIVYDVLLTKKFARGILSYIEDTQVFKMMDRTMV